MLGIGHVVVHSVSRWQSLVDKGRVGWIQKSMEEREWRQHIQASLEFFRKEKGSGVIVRRESWGQENLCLSLS